MTQPNDWIQAATLVHVFPTKIWIESDIAGSRHVVIQHQDGKSEPFTYASFHYDYRYTDNAGTRNAAEALARQLGAADPIEQRFRLPTFMDPAAVSCWCESCDKRSNNGLRSRMSLCPTCGNKRCPRAHNHEFACTGSNAPGQAGSGWENVKPAGGHGHQG